MTCYDCIHCERCSDIDGGFSALRSDVSKCKHFKPKSRYIELPCAVGDYVEWDNGLIKTLYCVMGYMCDSVGFRFILKDFSPVVNHRNITRVLTKEEALADRKEKENK